MTRNDSATRRILSATARYPRLFLITLSASCILGATVTAGLAQGVSVTAKPSQGATASPPVTGTLQAPRQLKLKQQQEATFSSPDTQVFSIPTKGGDYVRVSIIQREIDLAVEVSAPDGQSVRKVDESEVPDGEVVEFVATTSGDYRLALRPAAKDSSAGRYTVTLEEVRPATGEDRALMEVLRLYDETAALCGQGNYLEAIPRARKALELAERHLKEDALLLAKFHAITAQSHHFAGQFAQAKPFYERALAIRESALGRDHPDVGVAVNNLATLYHDVGDYKKTLELSQRTLDIIEKSQGKDHPHYATALNNIAALYDTLGDYKRAEEIYLRSLEIRERVLGTSHLDVGQSLNNLGALHYQIGEFSRAEPYYQRALDLHEKLMGKEHPLTAMSLYVMGLLRQAQGDYAEAERLYLRSLNIRESKEGSDHPNTALTLNGLGEFYLNMGDYIKSERMHERSLAITEKVYGPSHPAVADGLVNLASLYIDKGDFAKAEPLLQRALKIREEAFGPKHRDVANSLNNLAVLYRARGQGDRAEPLMLRTLEVVEATTGADSPYAAIAANNLALLYLDAKNYDKALSFQQRAQAILEKQLGKEHPDVANSLTVLGMIYEAQGDYGRAESLLLRSLDLVRKSFGGWHPRVAQTYDELAQLSEAQGKTPEAVSYRARANEVRERNIATSIYSGSERQKLLYLTLFSRDVDKTVSLHLRGAPADSKALRAAMSVVLQRKGRALDALADNVGQLRRKATGEDRRLLDELVAAKSRLAALVLRPAGKQDLASREAEVARAEKLVEEMEEKVGARSSDLRALIEPISLEAVRRHLPASTPLVEFVLYRPFEARKGSYEPARYAAYVLKADGDLKALDLGGAAEIDRSISSLREALRDPSRRDVKQLARAADALMMERLRPLLGGATSVILSPDGDLNLIPFGALVDEQKRFLVEVFTFHYVSSGRDLPRMSLGGHSSGRPVIVANPSYGAPARVGRVASGSTASPLSSMYFAPLPGTKQQLEALSPLFPTGLFLTGAKATEQAVKGVDQPSVLHVATHGFFLDGSDPTSDHDAGTGDQMSWRLYGSSDPLLKSDVTGARIVNPLLRSGLALAGANLQPAGDDGILTALELGGLNLRGTRLVVLSACDTGLGEVRPGDGVYGLRRALVLAGAESQVISLWKVSDAATRDLMVEYYKGLRVGKGRGEALTAVQRDMLMTTRRWHPYYWAGFIQSGDWRSF